MYVIMFLFKSTMCMDYFQSVIAPELFITVHALFFNSVITAPNFKLLTLNMLKKYTDYKMTERPAFIFSLTFKSLSHVIFILLLF